MRKVKQMQTAEKIAQTIKETMEGVGEGTVHGLKVATGMESGGTQTVPTIPVSTETAIPIRETTMSREHPNPTQVSSYFSSSSTINDPAIVATNPPTPSGPLAVSVSPIEALKENLEATGEKIKEYVGLGMQKGSEAGHSVSESVSHAGAKTSETIGEGLKSAGESTKHAGERATGERTRI